MRGNISIYSAAGRFYKIGAEKFSSLSLSRISISFDFSRLISRSSSALEIEGGMGTLYFYPDD